jgi:predicted esterase
MDCNLPCCLLIVESEFERHQHLAVAMTAKGRFLARIACTFAGTHPATIFMHELGASSTEFLSEAITLARIHPGMISLLLDAPWNKPAQWRRNFDSSKPDNDRLLQLEASLADQMCRPIH